MILVAGCNGPPTPRLSVIEYLKDHNYSQEVIDAAINGEKLPKDLIIKISTSWNIDAAHQIATNPTLTSEEIELFVNSMFDFVRAGVARNTNLSQTQIDKLFKDSSPMVNSYLARNPAVPEALLIRLRNEKKIGLFDFAVNPHCPEIIKEEIRKSNDDLAKKWLENTNQKKANQAEEHDTAR